ncbi:MAG: AbgT family transporter [Lachnospiraceae bacterium]|nr:AbgT family transporter [Lachnospiraceae bacterium]
MAKQELTNESGSKGFLGTIERIGNKVPHPVYLFIWLWVVAMLASWIFGSMGVSVINPTNGETVTVVSMMTSSAWADFLKNMGNTWMTFAPMITVPICTLGMAVATHSGMLNALLKSAGATKSEWKMALVVAFIGVIANLAGDAAFIVFPPLVAMLYVTTNRNPLDGMFLAYGSVAVGFGANILPGSADASLAALTEASAQTLDPSYVANPVMGWYFMFASSFVMTFACALVSLKFVEPRLRKENLGTSGIKSDEEYVPLTADEKKALRYGLIGIVGVLAVCAILCLPGLPFAAPEGGTVMTGYLFKCIPTIICALFFVSGYLYGKVAGTIKKFGDTIPMMQKELGTLASFFLICFFASQFISIFGASKMATVIAVVCGEWLNGLGLPAPLLMALFVVIVGFINLFMGSANGKWALMASIFVPMFMIAGINPAVVQVAYRMGDGLTNNITPCLAYLAILLGYAQQYEPRAKTGTVIAYQLPYTLLCGLIWIVFLVAWMMIGLPMGPGYGSLL